MGQQWARVLISPEVNDRFWPISASSEPAPATSRLKDIIHGAIGGQQWRGKPSFSRPAGGLSAIGITYSSRVTNSPRKTSTSSGTVLLFSKSGFQDCPRRFPLQALSRQRRIDVTGFILLFLALSVDPSTIPLAVATAIPPDARI